jgi:hypothetical protein
MTMLAGRLLFFFSHFFICVDKPFGIVDLLDGGGAATAILGGIVAAFVLTSHVPALYKLSKIKNATL